MIRLLLAFVSCSALGVFGHRIVQSNSALNKPTSDSLLIKKMMQAYPDHFIEATDNVLTWRDGTRMIFDDSIPNKDRKQRNETPDIEDMFYYPYPKGMPQDTPAWRFNPGTIRYEPFFKKMYGQTKADVQANLVDIVWLEHTASPITLKVTRVNGIADKIKQISEELEQRTDLLPYLVKPGGTFNWRVIAGTDQLSMHSFGIAVDINVKHSHYWRWSKEDPITKTHPYKNKIPYDIVEVFERYGFIWGGRWHNYDTMHFEYRPELFL